MRVLPAHRVAPLACLLTHTYRYSRSQQQTLLLPLRHDRPQIQLAIRRGKLLLLAKNRQSFPPQHSAVPIDQRAAAACPYVRPAGPGQRVCFTSMRSSMAATGHDLINHHARTRRCSFYLFVFVGRRRRGWITSTSRLTSVGRCDVSS